MTALLLLFGQQAPALAKTIHVDDREDFEVAGVAISGARFGYGARRVEAAARFSYLAEGAVDQYQFELRGANGRTWKIGWSPVEHTRFFTTFVQPGESARRVRCKVRWRESFEDQLAVVSFPARCLRLSTKTPPRRVRMGFAAEDFGQSYLYDAAPGGNSVVGGSPSLTPWISRG